MLLYILGPQMPALLGALRACRGETASCGRPPSKDRTHNFEVLQLIAIQMYRKAAEHELFAASPTVLPPANPRLISHRRVLIFPSAAASSRSTVALVPVSLPAVLVHQENHKATDKLSYRRLRCPRPIRSPREQLSAR